MKTKNFLMFALCVMSIFVAACGDENEPFADPDLLVASKLVNHGMSDDVVAENAGTSGVTLSYQTWIVVSRTYADGQTRSNAGGSSSGEGTIVSVTLNNILRNQTSTIEVADFDLKDYSPDVSYRELSSSRHDTQPYVSVIDSAVVYKVDRGNFAVEFVLPYQVAVYDDGFVKTKMPYHKYTEIIDQGGEILDLDNANIDGKNYSRKSYHHSIVATFNGKEYTVTAEIVLQKIIETDFLVSRKVIEEGVELKSYDLNAKTGVSHSWIKLEEEWSLSGTKFATVELDLKNGLPESSYRSFSLEVSSEVPYSSFVMGDVIKNISEQEKRKEGFFEIVPVLYEYKIPVTAPDGKKDNFMFGQMAEKAIYVDGDFRYEMPCLSYGGAVAVMSMNKDWADDEENVGTRSMELGFNVTVPFGSIQYTNTGVGRVYCRTGKK